MILRKQASKFSCTFFSAKRHLFQFNYWSTVTNSDCGLFTGLSSYPGHRPPPQHPLGEPRCPVPGDWVGAGAEWSLVGMQPLLFFILSMSWPNSNCSVDWLTSMDSWYITSARWNLPRLYRPTAAAAAESTDLYPTKRTFGTINHSRVLKDSFRFWVFPWTTHCKSWSDDILL